MRRDSIAGAYGLAGQILPMTGVGARSEPARSAVGPPLVGERSCLFAGSAICAAILIRVDYLSAMAAGKPEVFAGRVMRKFGIRFAEHHPRTEEVRHRFTLVGSLEDWRAVLDELYAIEPAYT